MSRVTKRKWILPAWIVIALLSLASLYLPNAKGNTLQQPLPQFQYPQQPSPTPPNPPEAFSGTMRGSVTTQMPADPSQRPQQPDPQASPPPNLEHLQWLINSPWVQATSRLIADPAFMSNLQQVAQHPKRINILYWLVSWIFFIMLLKAWRATVTDGWHRKLWLHVWTFGLFWGGVYLIPFVILGEPYRKVVSAIVGAVRTAINSG